MVQKISKTIGFILLFLIACKDLDRPIAPSAPEASFTIPTGKIYQGCAVLFTNTSKNAESYAWDFGDGQSSMDKNPTHIFNSAGSYTLKLKVTSSVGTNETTMKVEIYQNQTFEKSGGTLSLSGHLESGLLSSDGGYILIGNNNGDIIIKKLDVSGNEVWNKLPIDINGLDTGEDIIATSDGGFVVSGTTQNKLDGEHDIVLLKIKSDGTHEILKNFEKPNRQWAASIIQTKDSGFLIAGYSNIGNSADIYVIKTDANGNEQWSYNPTTPFDEKINDIIATTDGNYIMTGYRITNAGKQLLAVKIDNNGKEVWTPKLYDANEGNVIINTPNNSFTIVGYKQDISSGLNNLHLLKIDNNGTKIWGKGDIEKYGTIKEPSYDSNFADVFFTNDTYHIASSYVTSTTGVGSKGFFLKIDANGNKLPEKTYGKIGTNGYELIKIFQSQEDCGFVFFGTESIGSTNSMDGFYLVKTDAYGIIK